MLAWNQGNRNVLEQLMPLVYQELHRLTLRYLAAERRGHVLTAREKLNPRQARTVELRYVGGLSLEETAGIL
ncbi:MAG TPA: hypothetical protein PLK30_18930 [Blastocatellia bacterium]|nr:hypothetical protein [Blastocatellia bacterium]